MDSWKPSQLRQMELGGNKKLRDFFRQHGIADDTPIPQKYNTRAAEWYRRNLKALSEGTEGPPPLAEGTGHLPINGDIGVPQAVSSGAASSSFDTGVATSPSGALGSNAYHYGGGYHAGGGYHSGAGAVSSTHRRREMEGFGSDGRVGFRNGTHRSEEAREVITNVLGQEVGAKVTSGLLGTMGAVRSFASKSRSFLEEKVQKAQEEGWVDTLASTTKQGVDAAVETTHWAAQKGVEASKQTITYVNEGGGKEILAKTSEALGGAARQSITAVGSSADWVVDHLAGTGAGNANAAGLQSMSSGAMQGFGSDCPPPRLEAQAGSFPSRSIASSAAMPARRSYHEDEPLPSHQSAETSRPSAAENAAADASAAVSAEMRAPIARREATATTSPEKAALKAALWNDDDWGDWN